ncbi:extracellular solute-binding protein [Kineosporia sp. J2-2]|uniref:Extracellular solute-binding protein n=1 Tax=Kineosporia corallincola TaxID=2835133 RepID=A0ABS5TQ24_9ACTN|nr:extracellular solute-binding protein [Kineosporia corallincola]MBT0773206.1 extracellular solute-binding protein [Kineosporia corallincola]
MNRSAMSRRGFLGLGAGSLLGLAGCGVAGIGSGSGDTSLTMFHWAGDQATVPVRVGDEYAAAHGVKISYIEGTNAETFPKLVSSVQIDAGDPLLNLGFFNAQSFATGENSDLWLAVPDSVENLANVLPDYRIVSGHGAFMVMDAMGLIYNTEAFPTPPASWMQLFDSKYQGKVTTWDAPAFGLNGLPVIARIQGGDEGDFTLGMDEYAKAARRGQFSGFVASNDQLRKQLKAGEVVLAPGFQGVAQSWMDAGDPIGFAVPEEGVMAFPEGFQIIKGSTEGQVDAAAGLMDEIFDPANVSAYCAATATIPLVDGATLDKKYADLKSFQLETVTSSIQLDWATLVAATEDATTVWNDEVKSRM